MQTSYSNSPLIWMQRAWKDQPAKELIMLEAQVNYTLLYFSDGSKQIIARTLKQLTEELDANTFVRTHKSFLVNRHFIVRFDFETKHQIFLAGNHVAKVARRRQVEVKKVYLLL